LAGAQQTQRKGRAGQAKRDVVAEVWRAIVPGGEARVHRAYSAKLTALKGQLENNGHDREKKQKSG